MGSAQLAIIIPAFNEADSIAQVVSSVRPFGLPIVVDDCSTDSTAKLAESAGAFVVRQPQNSGYESALNRGFQSAAEKGCTYAVTFDADGQHDPALLPEIGRLLQEKYDMVVGVRSEQQRVGEKIFAFYTWMRWGLKDPLSGLKGYRLSLYKRLGHFDSYRSAGTELMIFALKQGAPFAQLPFQSRARISGASRFSSRALRANFMILRAMLLGL